MPKAKGRSGGREGEDGDDDATIKGYAKGWDLGELEEMLDTFTIARGWMLVANLKPGSRMRRVGVAGVRDWAKRLYGRGILKERYALAVVLATEKAEKAVQKMVTQKITDLKEANLLDALGSDKLPNLGKLQFKGSLKDGAHRTAALQLNLEQDPENEALYKWVPVVIYQRAVEQHTIVMSKVFNVRDKTGVDEDKLEKLTLCQGLVEQYWDEHYYEELKAKYKKSGTTWVDQPWWKFPQTQRPKGSVLLHYIKSVGKMKTTPGYYRQVLKASNNVAGKATEYLTKILDEAEAKEDRVSWG